MIHAATGTEAHGTGDINLAAAIMSMGVPLDPSRPCGVIHKDNGKSYGRFYLLPFSVDQKHKTIDLLHYWDDASDCEESNPFRGILDFIARRPFGCSNAGDWMDWAHVYLTEDGLPGAALPANFDSIPDFVGRFPELRESYVFAFVHNRRLALALFQNAKAQVMQTRGRASTLIDSQLPRVQQLELLARLEGS